MPTKRTPTKRKLVNCIDCRYRYSATHNPFEGNVHCCSAVAKKHWHPVYGEFETGTECLVQNQNGCCKRFAWREDIAELERIYAL